MISSFAIQTATRSLSAKLRVANLSTGGANVRVYDLKDEEGRVFAFEVDNAMLGRGGARRLVRRIPGARVADGPAANSDEFCHFEVDGVQFRIWDPWGDNSRYWVGPVEARWAPQCEKVHQAFRRAHALFGLIL